MTKAEAIAMLKRIQEPEVWEPQINQAAFEALDMAIEALDCSESPNSSDIISRQAVLHELDWCDYELKDWQRCKLKTMVRDITSAQPEPQWIPCSERLPDEDEDVLVCSEDGDIDIACWMPEQWTDDLHIEWWSGEYRVYAVAWIPLPEPYGGESE